jgi:hypothetical protein
MRGRNRLFGALALAALAGVVALVVVLVGGTGKQTRTAARPSGPAVRARAFVSPTVFLFGDTVRVRVEVLLDRRRVKPGDVSLHARFFPYKPVAPAKREIRSGGPLTLVTYSLRLRCLDTNCLPRVAPVHVQFAPARVVYQLHGATGSLTLTWPPLVVYSRVDLPDLANVDPDREAPWVAELTSLPKVTYGISPGLVGGLMIGGTGLFLLAALGLAWPFLARWLRLPVREPATHPLTALERALLVLEHDGVGEGAVEARRSALQLVAAELGRPFKPSRVVVVEALPKTRSAKILRRAVRAVAVGDDPGDMSSAENPSALEGIRAALA